MIGAKNPVSKIGIESRYWTLFSISMIYALSIQYVLSSYAAPNWPYFSFPYISPKLIDYIVLILSTAMISSVVPRYLDKPSNLILIFIYLFLIIPVIVASVCMRGFTQSPYYGITFTSIVLYIITCRVFNNKLYHKNHIFRQHSPILDYSILLLFLTVYAYLFYRFGSIMNLVGLDDLYEQRAIGVATNVFDGYAQVYGQYVLSPAMVALGLCRRNLLYVILGMVGSIISYSISAEKAGLLYPIFVIILYFLISSRHKLLKSTFILVFGCASLNIISVLFFPYSKFFEIICINFGVRTTLVPGSFTMHYYDFFVEKGFTYFTHIRGLDLIIDTPLNYLNDNRWPRIGLILGEDYVKYPTLNATANFIASDGVAGFGIIGIIIPFVLLISVLKIFDMITDGIDMKFVLPVLVPIALTLSNGSVFSVMTSFGGIFWMLIFRFLFLEVRASNVKRIRLS